MAAKSVQLNLKLEADVDRWLEKRAGGRDRRAEYVRGLIERDMAREREEAELRMFNEAARDLTSEDRWEREQLVRAFSGSED